MANGQDVIDNTDRDKISNIEAEQSILGCILQFNGVLAEIDELLVDDFYVATHRIIYKCMLDLWKAQYPIDLISVSDRLGKLEQLEKIGGTSYLAALVSSVISKSNIQYYCEIIREKSIKREALALCMEAQANISSAINMASAIDAAQKSILSLSVKTISSKEPSGIKSILSKSVEYIEERYNNPGKLPGISTGLVCLDDSIGGLCAGHLIILGARPAMGKTALMFGLCYAVAKQLPVLIFSLEMSKEQLGMRGLAVAGNLDHGKLRRGQLDNEDWDKLSSGMGKLAQMPIYIQDDGSIGLHGLRAQARRIQHEHGLGLIAVDYIQLMQDRQTKASTRDQEISEITRSLKLLAKELNVPVLAISQLNRSLEGRTNKRPVLSDLRESGGIEQDADEILFLYRDEYYNKDSSEKGIAEIIVGKSRHDECKTLRVQFDGPRMCFRDLAHDWTPPILPQSTSKQNRTWWN